MWIKRGEILNNVALMRINSIQCLATEFSIKYDKHLTICYRHMIVKDIL